MSSLTIGQHAISGLASSASAKTSCTVYALYNGDRLTILAKQVLCLTEKSVVLDCYQVPDIIFCFSFLVLSWRLCFEAGAGIEGLESLNAGLSCFEILNCLQWKVQREDLAFMCMMFWAIWLNRNALIHKQKVRQSREILDWVVSYLGDFQNTQSSLKCLPKDVQGSRAAVWLPPPVGSFSDKFQCSSSKGWPGLYWNWCSYLGFHGEGVGDYFEICEGIFFSAEIGVLSAVREGLIQEKLHGFSNCWVEMDAANVAAAIKDLRLCAMRSRFLNVKLFPDQGIPWRHNLASRAISS
ncbi:hypothetical protein QYF36_017700 [Acer negundo]|nr:hypothetical protein QYF36_017700 [Acer negundo]